MMSLICTKLITHDRVIHVCVLVLLYKLEF